MESNYLRYVRVTKLMPHFSKTLRLVGKLSDGAARADLSASGGVLGATHPENALLAGSTEHDMLLEIEAAAAHNRGQKQNVTFSRRDFFAYFVLPLQKLRSMHNMAWENRAFTFKNFLLNEIPARTLDSPPASKMYFNAMDLFL